MLFETLAIIALITPISATSAWVLRNDVEKIWQTILLYAGPIIDAWFVWLFVVNLIVSFLLFFLVSSVLGSTAILFQPCVDTCGLGMYSFSSLSSAKHKIRKIKFV